jgi:uncharacterized protein (TIGR00730 family)
METGLSGRRNEKRFRVVIFGSARIEKCDPYWNLIYDLAKRIAEEDMDVVTGGGPGLMNAASEGHYAGDVSKNAQSIGLQITLPKAQRDANHLDIKKEFSSFSVRLDNFIELANTVIVAPGGVGTLLEFFYTWQLMQVKMINHIPIILLGEMWPEFLRWIKKWLLKNGLLDQKDIDLLFLVKNNEEALIIIKEAYEKFRKQSPLTN